MNYFIAIFFFVTAYSQHVELWTRSSYLDTHIFDKYKSEFEFQFREQFITRTSNQEQQLYSFRYWIISKKQKAWRWQHSPFTYFYRLADFKSSQRSTHEIRFASQVDKNLIANNLGWRNSLEFRYFWGDIPSFNEFRYRTRLGVNFKITKNSKLLLNHEIMYRWNIDSEHVLWDQNRTNISLKILSNNFEVESGYQFHLRNANSNNISVHIMHLNFKYLN